MAYAIAKLVSLAERGLKKRCICDIRLPSLLKEI